MLFRIVLRQCSFYGGMAGMFVVSLCTFKKLGLKRWHALFFTFIALLSDGLGAHAMGRVYTLVLQSLGYDREAAYSIYGAVFLTPILIICTAVILKQPWKRIIDMVALSELFARAFGKLGCLFGGCCPGFEWEYGIYNYTHKKTMFPVQLCEFITIMVIIVIGFVLVFGSKKYVPGSLYPLTMLLYGATRFGWEFFRYYETEAERHLILGMSLWQFCSLIAVAVAVLWLVGMKKNWYEKMEQLVLQKQVAMLEAGRKKQAAKQKNIQHKKRKRK